MTELTKDNFETEVLQSKEVVLVDFWAPWCGPCKIQGPIVEELAEEMKDKPVKIFRLNIDDNQEVAQKYNIISIPTIIIFKAGEESSRLVGLQQKDALVESMEKYLV